MRAFLCMNLEERTHKRESDELSFSENNSQNFFDYLSQNKIAQIFTLGFLSAALLYAGCNYISKHIPVSAQEKSSSTDNYSHK